MKKILALVLALCMVFALAACGQQAAPAPAEKPAEQPAEAPAEQPAEAPAEQPAEEPAPAPASADDIPDEMTSADGKYEIAFVTDVGQLKDKSFNQGTYDGVKLYAAANNKSYKYYQPANGDQATDDDRYDAMKAAADNGAKVIVCAGFMQGNALAKAAAEFTDVMFIFIDGWAFDGLNNIAGIAFKEEQCGYLAGYATVKEGYTKLGFCGGGGGTNPACCRYGYGFVQGAAAAAAEMGVHVEMNYSWLYGASFSASPELQTLANGWYEAGTEAIFACGGSMFASVSAAASANDGAVIGVDVDHCPTPSSGRWIRPSTAASAKSAALPPALALRRTRSACPPPPGPSPAGPLRSTRPCCRTSSAARSLSTTTTPTWPAAILSRSKSWSNSSEQAKKESLRAFLFLFSRGGFFLAIARRFLYNLTVPVRLRQGPGGPASTVEKKAPLPRGRRGAYYSKKAGDAYGRISAVCD